ncbi:hypothetical protein [Haloarcula sp. JP-L23]|uniref:hypothetical protein n=1 Tax=Haloarcula sp. JP-L23 TaxID=2716717 RepID=UPI00140EF33F|nr:hypothetical protein G9465_24730 [Haloarcula sp. JP-L23]
MSSEADAEWPGMLICVPCEQYVPADSSHEETACDHSWGEATDISHLDGEEWAKFRHDVYVKYLNRDDPENRDRVFSDAASLIVNLTMAEALPDDYDEREGLERLLVLDAPEGGESDD